jgi:cyclopropane fatty-acyl-phospholipid synthase-like methyltransferase
LKTNSQVQKLYTKRAPLYDRLFIDFLGWGKELRAFFAKSNYLDSGLKILDAGCGTGVITKVLYQLALENRYEEITFHAFDLTQPMLDRFHHWIVQQGATHIELRRADVLALEGSLPADWSEYDLIVSSTMLEYLPRNRVKEAIANLKQRLRPQGILLLMITRRNRLTWWLARKWWKTTVYDEGEIRVMLHELGFHPVASRNFSPGWANSIMVIESKQSP